MYGAILGDIIGSPYEFDANNIKTKDFPLFSERSEFTDDTVMTCAVAEALLNCGEHPDREILEQAMIDSMRKYGHRYPFAGYGMNFSMWLEQEDPKPYDSFGNGSAMRVSAVPWLFQEDLWQALSIAAATAEVTHNHPEGIKGAQATAAVIFMALHGASKEEIKGTISKVFGYDLSRTCDEIRPSYHHVESCQETVPEAIIAFLEGESFEDVIRTAVSLGGDSDTLTAIAGSMAEAYYGVPKELIEEARKRLPEDLLEVVDRFTAEVKRRDEERKADPARVERWENAMRARPPKEESGDKEKEAAGKETQGTKGTGAVNGPDFSMEDRINAALEQLAGNPTSDNVVVCLEAIRAAMNKGGSFMTPVQPVEKKSEKGKKARTLRFRIAKSADGRSWQVVYTGNHAYSKGQNAKEPALAMQIGQMLTQFTPPVEGEKNPVGRIPEQIAGIVLNPETTPFFLTREMIGEIFKVNNKNGGK